MEWRSFRDEEPPRGERILVYSPVSERVLVRRVSETRTGDGGLDVYDVHIPGVGERTFIEELDPVGEALCASHWMPFPDPPDEGVEVPAHA